MLYLEFHLNNLSQNPYWNVRPVYLYLVFRIGAHRDNPCYRHDRQRFL